MTNKPYIGITGFTERGAVERLFASVPELLHRRLKIGVLVSAKTLCGIPNRWPTRFPNIRDVADIFTEDYRAFNVIHYISENRCLLFDELRYLISQGGSLLHGVQLHVTRPYAREVIKFSEYYSNIALSLQIGNDMRRYCGKSARTLARSIQNEYGDHFDYVLFDGAEDNGGIMSAGELSDYVSECADVLPHTGIGVWGGLASRLLERVSGMDSRCARISIDMDRGLRDTRDSIDTDLAREYVRAGIALLKEK